MTFIVGARLPTHVERGATGSGSGHSTEIGPLRSGHEQRNRNWSDSKGEWDIGYGLLHQNGEFSPDNASLDEVKAFHYVMIGMLHTFRFQDPSDHEIGRLLGTDLSPQFLGFGDDTTTVFQAIKTYVIPNTTASFDRTLTKLVASTYSVFLDAVLLVEGGGPTEYTVDVDTGLFTLGTAPASTGGTGPGGEEVLTFRSDFDTHVRFGIDHLKINMQSFFAGSLPPIPIIEVLGLDL